MNDIEGLKRRVQIFKQMNTPAHIITKDDTWLNGYIIEVSSDFFIFLDRKQGKLPVFFLDVKLFDFFVGDIDTLKKVDGVEDG